MAGVTLGPLERRLKPQVAALLNGPHMNSAGGRRSASDVERLFRYAACDEQTPLARRNGFHWVVLRGGRRLVGLVGFHYNEAEGLFVARNYFEGLERPLRAAAMRLALEQLARLRPGLDAVHIHLPAGIPEAVALYQEVGYELTEKNAVMLRPDFQRIRRVDKMGVRLAPFRSAAGDRSRSALALGRQDG